MNLKSDDETLENPLVSLDGPPMGFSLADKFYQRQNDSKYIDYFN